MKLDGQKTWMDFLLTGKTTFNLLTVYFATKDLHTKHCNYDLMLRLSFFYYIIITLSLRDMIIYVIY